MTDPMVVAAFDAEPDGLLCLAPMDDSLTGWVVRAANRSAHRLLGDNALVNRRLDQICPPLAEQLQVALMQAVADGARPIVLADLSSWTASPPGLRLRLTRIEGGALVRMESSGADDSRYRSVVDSQPALICRTDAQGILTFANRAYLRRSLDRLPNGGDHRLAEILMAEDRGRIADLLARLAEPPHHDRTELRIDDGAGNGRWYGWEVTGLVGPDGTIAEFQWVGVDIEADRSNRMAVGLREARYRLIAETLPGCFLVLDGDGIIRMLGGRDSDAFVPTGRQALDHALVDVFAAEPVLVGLVRRAMAGESFSAEAVVGSTIFGVTLRPILDSAGRVEGCMVLALDATERYDLQAQLTAIFDRAPVAIAVCRPDGSFLHTNQRMSEILGYSDLELRQSTVQALTYPGDLDSEQAVRAAALAEGTDYYEIKKRFKRRDGRVVLTVTQVQVLRGRDGQPSLECLITRDIGDTIRMEQQLERNRWRMEMIGRFVEGVAYDLKFLRRQQHTGGIIDPLYDIWDSARFDALLAFLDRRGVPDLERVPPISVATLIEERVWDWQIRLDDSIKLSAEILDPNVGVRVLRDDLVEMLDHLISNACFAVERGGAIRISVETVELPQIASDHFMHLYPGDYVQITLSDDGAGMQPEVAARAWDPFFAAWPSRPTTGVGLTLTRAIARRWDGDVMIESLPGFGTTVTVVLPRHLPGALPRLPS